MRFAVLLALAASTMAQAEPHGDIVAFERFYALSYRIEGCGDGRAATLLRRALWARFDQCHFPQAAQAEFFNYATNAAASAGHRHPDNFSALSCRFMQGAAAYAALRRKLILFRNGMASAADIIAGPCRS